MECRGDCPLVSYIVLGLQTSVKKLIKYPRYHVLSHCNLPPTLAGCPVLLGSTLPYAHHWYERYRVFWGITNLDENIYIICLYSQEMNLLVEADQPGNQLDDYVSRLNTILSQKAESILQLQNCLTRFQRRLKEHNVVVPSYGS